MDLLSYRASLVEAFKALVPAKTLKVQAHPGRFDLGELNHYSVDAPCLLVAVLAWPLNGQFIAVGDVEIAAYLLTKSKRDGKHDELNLQIATLLLTRLASAGIDGRSVTQIRWTNLYAGALGQEGVSLSAISFRQSLLLEAPADPDATLGSFKTLFATWDFAADAKPEATNQITLEGA